MTDGSPDGGGDRTDRAREPSEKAQERAGAEYDIAACAQRYYDDLLNE